LKESAVKALAKQHHIPVYTPLTLRVEKGGEETAEVLAKMQEANPAEIKPSQLHVRSELMPQGLLPQTPAFLQKLFSSCPLNPNQN